MTENEMLAEIERLTRELEAANKSRGRLIELIAAVWPLDPPEVVEKEVEEMLRNPSRGSIADLIAEMAREDPDVPPNQQIPA